MMMIMIMMAVIMMMMMMMMMYRPAQSNSQRGEWRQLSAKNVVDGRRRIISNHLTTDRLPVTYLHRTYQPVTPYSNTA